MIDNEALKLFCECFPDTEKEAGLILDFAEAHGRIYKRYCGNELICIICTSPIKDGAFYAEYIFACGVKKEYRGQGVFKSLLSKIIGSTPAILIPENEGLYSMYRRLGFTPIYCLHAFFDGDAVSLVDCEIETAKRIYRSSSLFPKKSEEMLDCSLKTFLSYGGELKTDGSAVMLMHDGKATEIFASGEREILSAARQCKSAYLPLSMQKTLDEAGIKYETIKLAAAINLPKSVISDIYINNLFN